MSQLILWFEERVWATQLIKTMVLLVIVGGVLVLATRMVRKVFSVRDGNQKKQSVYPILIRCINGLLFFVAFCFALEIMGVSTTPLWAMASAFSVALGFGAQAVIKDIISGFLILTEDHFNVGDIVEISGKQGKVEEIGLRITRLRDAVDGAVYIVPNGDMGIVTNQTKDFMFAIIEVPVPYDQDLNNVLEALREIAHQYPVNDLMIDKPDVLGVTAYNDSAMAIRIICKTHAHQNWAVERALRAHFKIELEARNIIIPFPTQTVHLSA